MNRVDEGKFAVRRIAAIAATVTVIAVSCWAFVVAKNRNMVRIANAEAKRKAVLHIERCRLAASMGDFDRLSTEIAKGPPLDSREIDHLLLLARIRELGNAAAVGDLKRTVTMASLCRPNDFRSLPEESEILGAPAWHGHDAVISFLLDRGWKPDGERGLGGPLGVAATQGHMGTVRLLLSRGAKANLPRGGDGWTPLMSAAAMGRAEVVNLLLKYHADPRKVATKGETAASLARRYKHIELANSLDSAAARASKPNMRSKF